jgi:hypothetical protein
MYAMPRKIVVIRAQQRDFFTPCALRISRQHCHAALRCVHLNALVDAENCHVMMRFRVDKFLGGGAIDIFAKALSLLGWRASNRVSIWGIFALAHGSLTASKFRSYWRARCNAMPRKMVVLCAQQRDFFLLLAPCASSASIAMRRYVAYTSTLLSV